MGEQEERPNWLNETVVTSVLLADGWHEVIPYSFTVDPFLFIGEREHGFKFRSITRTDDYGEKPEDDYAEQILAGPLTSILAVRCGNLREVNKDTLGRIWLRMVK